MSLASDWYAARLAAKQQSRHPALAADTRRYLQNFLKKKNYAEEAERLGIKARLKSAWENHHAAKSPEYLSLLKGTIGLQPL